MERNERDRAADQLARAFDGDAWCGPSLLAVLDGVTAEVASAHPIAGKHSIWEIVWHVAFWKRVEARRLRGETVSVNEAEQWPRTVESGPDAWRDMLEELRRSQREVMETIAALDPAELDQAAGEQRDPASGTGVTRYVLIHGLAQHDLYHAAQVALLKAAVAMGTPPP